MPETPLVQPTSSSSERQTFAWDEVLGAPAPESPAPESPEVSHQSVEAPQGVVVAETSPQPEQQPGGDSHAPQGVGELPADYARIPEEAAQDEPTAVTPEHLPTHKINPAAAELIEIAEDNPTDPNLVALSQATHTHGGN